MNSSDSQAFSSSGDIASADLASTSYSDRTADEISQIDAERKVAILFEQDGHCAVLDVAKLAAGDIIFGSNSWRGDRFEEPLPDDLRAEPRDDSESGAPSAAAA